MHLVGVFLVWFGFVLTKGLGEILKQLRQRQAEDRSRVGCRREMGEGGGRQTGRGSDYSRVYV